MIKVLKKYANVDIMNFNDQECNSQDVLYRVITIKIIQKYPADCYRQLLTATDSRLLLRFLKSNSDLHRQLRVTSFILLNITTMWKVSKYGVFFGPYFPVFELNTEIYEVNLRIQSECRKIWTRKNSIYGHFSHSERV